MLETKYLLETLRVGTYKGSFSPEISGIMQRKVIDSLWTCNTTLGLDLFYFIIDWTTLELKEKKGIYDILGFFDSDYKLEHFFDGIPAIQKPIFALQMANQFQKIDTKQNGLDLLQQKNVVLHGIQQQAGEYLYVKRLTFPFQRDALGQITETLNVFFPIGIFSNQEFKILNVDYQDKFVQPAASIAPIQLPFTNREMDLIKSYANNMNWTAEQHAERLNVKYNTILTHKVRTLHKARSVLSLHCSTFQDLATRLREMGVV